MTQLARIQQVSHANRIEVCGATTTCRGIPVARYPSSIPSTSFNSNGGFLPQLQEVLAWIFTPGFVLRTRNDDDDQQYDDTGNQAQPHPLDSQ